MAEEKCEVRMCMGGVVQFSGTWGQAASVYATKNVRCENAFQDEKYGKHMRLHNPQQAKNRGSFRCTVCGKGAGIVRP